jgi:starch phosphorylase
MVQEYMDLLYQPAHEAYLDFSKGKFELVRQRSTWSESVYKAWDRVGFVELGPGPDRAVHNGSPVPLRATVNLAGLQPEDVKVEAVVGRVGANGTLEGAQVLALKPVEQRGSAYLFSHEFVPMLTGRMGYSLRISPNHSNNPLTRQCHPLLKWDAE